MSIKRDGKRLGPTPDQERRKLQEHLRQTGNRVPRIDVLDPPTLHGTLPNPVTDSEFSRLLLEKDFEIVRLNNRIKELEAKVIRFKSELEKCQNTLDERR